MCKCQIHSGTTGYFWLDIQWPVTVTKWKYDDLTAIAWSTWSSFNSASDLYAVQSLTSAYLWYGDKSNSISTAFELCQSNT